MRLDCSHTYETKNKKIKLVAESFEEPNYGRTFWKYKFYINSKLIENDILKYENEGLFSNLDSFVLSSNDSAHIYIPKYKPVLYNVKEGNFKEFEAPLKNGSRDFLKNYFYENNLIIIYRNGVVKVDLSSYMISSLEYSVDDVFIEEGKQINEEEIELEYRDLKELQFKKRIIKL